MKKAIYFLFLVIISNLTLSKVIWAASKEVEPYLISLFDSTDNDFYFIGILNATVRMVAENSTRSECLSEDGTKFKERVYAIKQPILSPYRISFNIIIQNPGGPCQFEFGGGNLALVVQSAKTGEKKLLLAAIDRFFRNRPGGVGSDLYMSASQNPQILGSVLMESHRPVIRILE